MTAIQAMCVLLLVLNEAVGAVYNLQRVNEGKDVRGMSAGTYLLSLYNQRSEMKQYEV